MDSAKKITDRLRAMSGSRSAQKIFTDWIQMLSHNIMLAFNTGYNEERRERRDKIAATYSENEIEELNKLTELLVTGMEEEMTDVLGILYQQLGINEKRTGQFFTPFSVCRLMSKMTNLLPEEGKILTLNEPCVGSGGNIIACMGEMKDKGINYQKECMVYAQDTDFICVCMSYIQLSLYGIPAIIKHGNTLTNPYTEGEANENIYITPFAIPLLMNTQCEGGMN